MIADTTTRSRNQAQRHGTFGTGHSRRRSRSRSIASQLTSHTERLLRQRRSLANIATCVRDQSFMLPMQCEEARLRLDELRRVAGLTRAFLEQLDPETTKQLRPYACIAKLVSFDFWVTQAILTLAMFEPLCQSVCYERIELHLYLRSLFLRIKASFEDTISQLGALSEMAKRRARTAEEVQP